jgi:hypothetical protein
MNKRDEMNKLACANCKAYKAYECALDVIEIKAKEGKFEISFDNLGSLEDTQFVAHLLEDDGFDIETFDYINPKANPKIKVSWK